MLDASTKFIFNVNDFHHTTSFDPSNTASVYDSVIACFCFFNSLRKLNPLCLRIISGHRFCNIILGASLIQWIAGHHGKNKLFRTRVRWKDKPDFWLTFQGSSWLERVKSLSDNRRNLSFSPPWSIHSLMTLVDRKRISKYIPPSKSIRQESFSPKINRFPETTL